MPVANWLLGDPRFDKPKQISFKEFMFLKMPAITEEKMATVVLKHGERVEGHIIAHEEWADMILVQRFDRGNGSIRNQYIPIGNILYVMLTD